MSNTSKSNTSTSSTTTTPRVSYKHKYLVFDPKLLGNKRDFIISMLLLCASIYCITNNYTQVLCFLIFLQFLCTNCNFMLYKNKKQKQS